MADTKLSALTENNSPDGSNLGYVVTGGANSRKRYLPDDNLLPDGFAMNYELEATVAANDLTLTLTTKSGGSPSTTDPVTAWINGVYRRGTAALTVTKADGTNWCNSGGAELGTKEVDYFVYLIWNTTPATDIMDIGFSRFPAGRVYSDFSTTTTNEKYLAFGNASTPNTTDNCILIGRFAATLSLTGTGHLWTVPAFTHTNLVQRPIFETRLLDWTPAWSASASMTYTTVTTTIANYQIVGRRCKTFTRASGTIGGTPSTTVLATLPFESALIATAAEQGAGTGDSVFGRAFISAGTPDQVSILRYDAANWTAGARVAAAEIEYWI
jgi:hypothetical protein